MDDGPFQFFDHQESRQRKERGYMTMPVDLVLVRHGESEGNIAIRRSRDGDHSAYTPEFCHRHSSQWRLTPTGRTQAEAAGRWIWENIGDTFDRYYASEYLRAMETAAHLGLPNAQWFLDFYLRERDWGEFDTMPQDVRRQRIEEQFVYQANDRFFWAPPNGESMAQVCLRVDRLLHTLHRECSEKRVIVVCHGEVMWAFRVRLERMSQQRFHELDQSDDPKDKIHNAHVLYYTRRNPETREMSPYLDWMRSICPTDLSLSRNVWSTISRPRYTNDQLLDIVGRVTPLIADEEEG